MIKIIPFFFYLILLIIRPISKEDINVAERKYQKTMENILMKKRRLLKLKEKV